MSRSSHPMRFDIQLLRGLAILLVVAYHTGIGVGAGYLGVDIFFVVSGYLITQIIVRELDAGTFRFRDFYTRRAKRLLPAAYVTFALTTLAAMWLLTSREFIDFSKTLRGAMTFTGNLALLGQTGYFDGAPETKPLLHTWSLAIEEQYYLALPLLLWLLHPRLRALGVGVLMIASLALCFWWRGSHPNEVFFRIEFRAWELGIGSLAAFAMLARKEVNGGRVLRGLFWPALAVVIVLPWLPMFYPHPGVHALLLDLATAIVLVRNHRCFAIRSSQRWLRPLARIGDVSYSWYLLHWPPIVFLSAVYLGEPPGWVKVAAALGSLFAAALMYRFVEQPARYHPFRFTLPGTAAVLTISGLLFAAPYLWQQSAHLDQRVLARADNVGFDERCDFDSAYRALPVCENAKNPQVLVWGDSLAMHLVSALVKVSADGIRQATKTSCGPLLGLAPVNDKRLTPAWAAECQRFNQDVLAKLEQSPSIQTVVLGSSFQRFANPRFGEVLVQTGPSEIVTKPSVALAEAGFRKTVTAITRLGKRVVIVAPPPSTTFDVGACLERRFYGKPTLGPHASCQIDDATRREEQHNVLALMAEAKRWPGVKLIDLAGPLCQAGVCRTVQGSVPLYVDEQHFTVAGSMLLANAYDWRSWTRHDASPLNIAQQETGR